MLCGSLIFIACTKGICVWKCYGDFEVLKHISISIYIHGEMCLGKTLYWCYQDGTTLQHFSRGCANGKIIAVIQAPDLCYGFVPALQQLPRGDVDGGNLFDSRKKYPKKCYVDGPFLDHFSRLTPLESLGKGVDREGSGFLSLQRVYPVLFLFPSLSRGRILYNEIPKCTSGMCSVTAYYDIGFAEYDPLAYFGNLILLCIHNITEEIRSSWSSLRFFPTSF